MPIELLCGECQGWFAAEQPGSVVACPHCGAHLQVPGDPADMNLEPPSQILPTDNEPAPAGELISSNLEAADELEPEPPAVETVAALFTVSETMALEEAAPSAIVSSAAIPLADLSLHSTPRMPLPEAAAPSTRAFAAPIEAASVSTVASPPEPPSAIPPAPASRLPVDLPGQATVPKFWFTLLLGYSSAATLALLFLLYILGRIKAHPLESLPDIVPEVRNGEIGMKVARAEDDVAPGHVLRIGETRRFGSVNVTPLRITQGPLRFERVTPGLKGLKSDKSGNASDRPASEPVLKLWMRFENVSGNQTFSPLDAELLFRRKYQGVGESSLTNQFLCKQTERRRGGDLRYLFEQSTTSEFRLAGQQLDTVLGPGQTNETFIPSEEYLDSLDGDLVWRVQFRKGYHPRTRHGVTTLIDVPFSRKDVKLES